MEQLKDKIRHFSILGEIEAISPLGEGLINDTYLVTTSGTGPDYVLQRINHNVFKNVDGMQQNIEAVTSHIRKKLEDEGCDDISRKTLDFIEVQGSSKTYYNDGNNYWRISRFIPNSMTLQEVTPTTAFQAGKAYGNFQNMLSDIESELEESIPDFHNMEVRLQQLRDAIKNDPAGRVKDVTMLINEIESRAEKMCEPERMHREGRLPKRICHCDTKVNNMLFDENGDVLCVIDLDTVMPSFVFSDYGDFLRTGACTSAEDEPDLTKIDFKFDIFKSFTEGYISEAKSFLTKEELEWLPNSVLLFPYMQCVRFLTDYINGDTYYKIGYPTHNLVRARAQMQLMNKIEGMMPQIKETFRTLDTRLNG